MPFPKCIKLLGFIATVFSSALSETAQCQFSIEQPFFASPVASGDIPSQAGILLYRWVATDTTNSTVNTWVDRIQGNVLFQTNGTANQGPPKSNATGVVFFGTNLLYSTNIIFNPSTNSLMLITADMDANLAAIARQIWGEISTTIGFQLADQGSGSDVQWYNGVTTFLLADFYSYPPNTNDLLLFKPPNVTGVCYTNGVVSTTNTHSGDFGPGLNLQAMGQSPGVGGNTRLKGAFKEICIWAGTNFSAATISNLHYYATNTYKFSP